MEAKKSSGEIEGTRNEFFTDFLINIDGNIVRMSNGLDYVDFSKKIRRKEGNR